MIVKVIIVIRSLESATICGLSSPLYLLHSDSNVCTKSSLTFSLLMNTNCPEHEWNIKEHELFF